MNATEMQAKFQNVLDNEEDGKKALKVCYDLTIILLYEMSKDERQEALSSCKGVLEDLFTKWGELLESLTDEERQEIQEMPGVLD
jgi:flagellin-specific chaperone FliS